MRITHLSLLAGTAAVVLAASAALAAGSPLPGDRGRPGDGVPTPPQVNAPPRPPRVPGVVARAPAIDLAMKAALAIAKGCKQYPLGLAIVDSAGVATLIYVPDGAEAWHGYSAVRKAYTAVTFKMPTSELIKKIPGDATLADKIRADVNLQGQSGGIPLMVGGELVGAIGVSGAEPGGHDEECGLMGLEAIKKQLK